MERNDDIRVWPETFQRALVRHSQRLALLLRRTGSNALAARSIARRWIPVLNITYTLDTELTCAVSDKGLAASWSFSRFTHTHTHSPDEYWFGVHYDDEYWAIDTRRWRLPAKISLLGNRAIVGLTNDGVVWSRPYKGDSPYLKEHLWYDEVKVTSFPWTSMADVLFRIVDHRVLVYQPYQGETVADYTSFYMHKDMSGDIQIHSFTHERDLENIEDDDLRNVLDQLQALDEP